MDKNKMNFEFIDYDGKYPNLCTGVLTLKINGVIHKFNSYNKHLEGNPYLEKFWVTGGNCGFTNGYMDSYVNRGEWEVNVGHLPDFLKPYADELIELFNDNVPYGCCGGCL